MNLIDSDVEGSGGGTGDEHLVANRKLTSLAGELCHTELGEILHTLAHILLALGGTRAIVLIPLTKGLPLVVTIPETTIEDSCQLTIPLVFLSFGEGAVENGLDGCLVALHHRQHIFRTTGTTFNLEDTHTRLHHAIDETDGLEVFGTHDVLVVNLQLGTRLAIGDDVGATTYLHALTTIGRATSVVETHIALATDSHAQSTMTEHFDADLLTRRTTDVLFLNLPIDVGHLVEVEFASQDHHIGKLGIELKGLDVRDVQLGGEVNLHATLAAIGHDGNVAGNDSRDMCLDGSIDNLVHQCDILAIDNGVDGEVALHPMLLASSSNLAQIVNREMIGRM